MGFVERGQLERTPLDLQRVAETQQREVEQIAGNSPESLRGLGHEPAEIRVALALLAQQFRREREVDEWRTQIVANAGQYAVVYRERLG